MSDLATAIQFRADGRFTEAQLILDELLEADPENARLNYHYAWLYDVQGLETEAVPYYIKATADDGGLSGEELRGALLGLGSTYRALGRYEEAIHTIERGITEFPDAKEFTIFLAMAFYNVGRHMEAMELLLRTMADTSADPGIQRFAPAIRFYSNQLDMIWT